MLVAKPLAVTKYGHFTSLENVIYFDVCNSCV